MSKCKIQDCDDGMDETCDQQSTWCVNGVALCHEHAEPAIEQREIFAEWNERGYRTFQGGTYYLSDISRLPESSSGELE